MSRKKNERGHEKNNQYWQIKCDWITQTQAGMQASHQYKLKKWWKEAPASEYWSCN